MSPLTRAIGQAFFGSFKELRSTQALAVEPILSGDDVLILSRTGSGKTEAVTAPMVQRYCVAGEEKPRCALLYVTPTRALANDLLRRLQPPMEHLGFVVGIRHGERNDLGRRRKPDLLITTPESLDVMLTSGEPALLEVQALVLDEVHLTYNTQRGFQLAVLIKRLEQFVQRPLQTAGLSATVATAADIWAFFRPGREVTSIEDPEGRPIDYQVRETNSPEELIALLDRLATGRRLKALLFTNSRRECDRLGASVGRGTAFAGRTFVHHSSLSRDARLEAEQSFQEEGTALCIATSTLELGVDIGDVDVVVLYGRPTGWESFVQRVGRGNRRSDKANVVCVVAPEHGSPFLTVLGFEALVSQIRSGRIERARPMDFFGAAVQQLLSAIFAKRGAYQRVADLASLFDGWHHLGRPIVEEILDHLANEGYLTRHGFQNRYGADEGLHRLADLRLIWGNFPNRSRDVRLTVSGRELGVIPATNLLRLVPGETLRFAGRYWAVRRVQPDVIEVEPSRQRSGLEVAYAGGHAPLDASNVEEMLRLIESGLSGEAIAPPTRGWFLEKVRVLQSCVGWDRLPMARDKQGYHYFTFAGEVVNGAIARWAGSTRFEVGEIELVVDEAVDFAGLPDEVDLEPFACQGLRLPDNLTIFQGMLPPNLLERELAEIWRKTPVYERSIARLRAARIQSVDIDELGVLCG